MLRPTQKTCVDVIQMTRSVTKYECSSLGYMSTRSISLRPIQSVSSLTHSHSTWTGRESTLCLVRLSLRACAPGVVRSCRRHLVEVMLSMSRSQHCCLLRVYFVLIEDDVIWGGPAECVKQIKMSSWCKYHYHSRWWCPLLFLSRPWHYLCTINPNIYNAGHNKTMTQG